jgi:hypothetical protein
MSCGCGCGMARARHLGALTVTATDFPCKPQWAAAQKSPTLANKTIYNLCVAENKATRYITDGGHWIWQEIRNLWARLWNATKAIGAAAVRAIGAAGDWTLLELQKILKKSQSLLDWLISKFERAGLELLAVVGIVAGVIWFAPEIIEGIGGAYEAKYRRHYSKKVNEDGRQN